MTHPAPKSIVLHQHEVARLLAHSDALLVRPCKDQRRYPCTYDLPFGPPGTRLVGKETWADEYEGTACPDDRGGTLYRATDPGWDDENTGLRWRPASAMTQDRSRLTLEVVAVEAKQVHKVTNADVVATGLPREKIEIWEKFLHPHDVHGHAFGCEWNAHHRKCYPWASNPWAWFVRVRVVKEPSRG